MSNHQDQVDISSSDGVQFLVRKSLLSLASPVFSDMFSVPQPNSSLGSDAPTDPINLSEPSKTIRLILSLCELPITSIFIDSLLDIADLFLNDIATLAAQRTLRYPLLHAEYFSDLEIVDGGTIYRVLQYHKQCTVAAVEVATNHTWIRDAYVFFDCPEANSGEDDENEEDNRDEGLQIYTTTIRTRPSRKYKNGFLKPVSVHPWWIRFMATTKVALSESPYSETIRDKDRVMEALSSASQCSHCRKLVKSEFSNFLDTFVKEVEARVNEIKLVTSAKCPANDDTQWQ